MFVFQHPFGFIWPYIFISCGETSTAKCSLLSEGTISGLLHSITLPVRIWWHHMTYFSWFWYTSVVVMLNLDITSNGFSYHHHTCNCSLTNTISNKRTSMLKINFCTKFQTSSDKCPSVTFTIPRATYRFYRASILSFNFPQNLQTKEHHSPISDHQEMAHNDMKRNNKSDVF
jgi:hypothetical protein